MNSKRRQFFLVVNCHQNFHRSLNVLDVKGGGFGWKSPPIFRWVTPTTTIALLTITPVETKKNANARKCSCGGEE